MTEAPDAGCAGASALTPQGDSQALAALSARQEVAPLAVQANTSMTVVRFDPLLVDQLGLGDVATHVQQSAAAAGLAPESTFTASSRATSVLQARPASNRPPQSAT